MKVQVPSKTPPAPGIPPPEIKFLEEAPGGKENYTLTVLDTSNITQESEREHIQEHLDVPLSTENMTEKELQFHFFKMHDTDHNNMLDGTELCKSMIHQHGHNRKGETVRLFKDYELEQIIDSILAEDDANNDGFIDYYEFKRAQEKNAN